MDIEALHFPHVKRLAQRFHMAVSNVPEGTLRARVKSALAVYCGATSDSEQDAKVDSANETVAYLNHCKLRRTHALKQAVTAAPHYVTNEDPFKIDINAATTWSEVMELPITGGPRREKGTEHRVVKLQKFAVDEDGFIGYVVAEVQASLPISHFHSVILKVGLKEVERPPGTNLAEHREVATIEEALCLMPEGVVDAEGKMCTTRGGRPTAAVKASKPCRGGQSCMHVCAVLRALAGS